jgi:hypothetical protein
MVEKLTPEPVEGVPPVVVQANVYGVRPLDPVAVQATAVLTVPVAGQLMDTVGAMMPGLIVMLADAVAVAVLALVAMTVTVKTVATVTV